MRTILLSLTAATAIVSAVSLGSTRADAMPIGSATTIQDLLQSNNMIEDLAVVCRHRTYSSRQRCRTVLICRHRSWDSRRVCR